MVIAMMNNQILFIELEGPSGPRTELTWDPGPLPEWTEFAAYYSDTGFTDRRDVPIPDGPCTLPRPSGPWDFLGMPAPGTIEYDMLDPPLGEARFYLIHVWR